MISIPKKKCNKNNCNELIDYRNKYCEKHKELINQSNKDYERYRNERDKTYIQFYQGRVWKSTRKSVMLEFDYVCQECIRQGYYKQANVVDHIIELKDDWSKRLDKDNLIPLCHSCHNKKTKEEQRRRGTS